MAKRQKTNQSRSQPSWPVAIHEAAHAIHAVHIGLDLNRVDVKRRTIPTPDGEPLMISNGYTDATGPDWDLANYPDGMPKEMLMPYMIHVMVGPVAEFPWNQRALDFHEGVNVSDWMTMLDLMTMCLYRFRLDDKGDWMVVPEDRVVKSIEMKRLTDEAITHACHFLMAHQNALHAVANALVKQTTLTGPDVKRIMDEHPPGPDCRLA